MGIFAPPLTPRPKTKYQRDILIQKHAGATEAKDEEEVKSAMSETKDVPITANDNKEANLKLTLPVLVSTKEKSSTQIVVHGEKENDAISTNSTANSDGHKDETYLTTENPAHEPEKSSKITEKAIEEEEADIQIQIPEMPKPRYDFDRSFGVILPDIRINNYTVPSPIQEEDEERRSSVAMEEMRAESVAKVGKFTNDEKFK